MQSMLVRKYTIKFSRDEAEAFQKFCDQLRRSGDQVVLQMSREQIAKQAIFYAISDMHNRARDIEAQQGAVINQKEKPSGPPTSRDSEGDISETRESEATSSNVLAGAEGAVVDTRAGASAPGME